MVLGTEALFDMGSANFALQVSSELRCHSLCMQSRMQSNGTLDDAGEPLDSALSASCDDYCWTVDTADPDIQANLKCMAECTLEKWGDKAAPGPGEYVACEGECAGVKCDAYAGMCAGGSKVFASAAAVFLAATVAAAF